MVLVLQRMQSDFLPLIIRAKTGMMPVSAPRLGFHLEDPHDQMTECSVLAQDGAPDPWIFPLSSLTMNLSRNNLMDRQKYIRGTSAPGLPLRQMLLQRQVPFRQFLRTQVHPLYYPLPFPFVR